MSRTPDNLPPLFPNDLVLAPVSRWPTRLSDETIRAVLERPLPAYRAVSAAELNLPQVSLVVVTFNNLVFNRLCLESVLGNTLEPPLELIIVDNGSTDGTPDYLRQLAECDQRVRLIFNSDNRGFAAANNQAFTLARAEMVVLLNNDTIVPPDWLANLIQPLTNPSVGMVGPVTNRIGNEAEIVTNYRTYGEFLQFTAKYAQEHRGERRELDRLILFCAALRREVLVQIGPLDELFELGMFEDDDFSCRLRAAGFKLLLVEDAVVHHFGQASLGKLAATGEYGNLFHANRRRWEEKWGRAWQPYTRRENPQYDARIRKLWSLCEEQIPANEIVLVVSRGDEALVNWSGWQGWHFPRNATGEYAGFHPQDSMTAQTHLEELQSQGARWFVLPQASAWWWEYYADFRDYLTSQHELILDDPQAGRVFRLR